MIDNREIIYPLLEFNEGDFYYIHIIRRRKENKEMPVGAKIIKEYSARSTEYIDKRWGEITGLCDYFNARAMININRCSDEGVCLHMLRLLATQVEGRTYSGKNLFRSACAKAKISGQKYWLLDVDVEDMPHVDLIEKAVAECEPNNDVVKSVPSKSGTHLIAKPFNRTQFEFNLDINKTAFTNLFIP